MTIVCTHRTTTTWIRYDVSEVPALSLRRGDASIEPARVSVRIDAGRVGKVEVTGTRRQINGRQGDVMRELYSTTDDDMPSWVREIVEDARLQAPIFLGGAP